MMETVIMMPVKHQSHNLVNDIDAYRDYDAVHIKDNVEKRPRKVTFYKNGDRYFAGKMVTISPSRYYSFKDLMNHLNRCVDLPYGVRRVYTPVGGREINDIDELLDGSSYVCASFEPFRHAKYGELPSVNWQSVSKNPDLPTTSLHSSQPLPSIHQFSHSNQNYYLPKVKQIQFANNGFILSNSVNFANKKTQANNFRVNASVGGPGESVAKPRIITIIRATERPRKRITILLNRKALHSFEQFVCDISDAFGLPQWKNDKIRKLYTLKGKRVQGISDFFRDDDMFIGVSGKEPLKGYLIVDLLQEVFPDNAEYAQSLFKEWESSRSRSRAKPRHSSMDNHSNRNDIHHKETVYNTDGEVSVDKKSNFVVEFDGNGRRKKKKKVADSDLAVDMEMQRQRERLKLIEIERKKKEQNNKENLNSANQSKVLSSSSSSNSKRVNILSPINNSDNSQSIENKKPKRKIKFRPKAIREASKEQDSTERKAKKSPTVMSIKEQDTPRNQVKSKSPLRSPKDQEVKDSKDEEKKHVTKAESPVSNKLKRQITNFNRILDRYEILKTLGDGNFAVVKHARLKNTEHEYAIKIIDKSKMRGKENMIENEIRIMKSCSHPNIVKLHEEFETKEEVYLITDLVKGGDLFDAISQSVKFNEKDSASMVQDICEALFYLHSKNIVHRDLKPENLLVMRKKDDRISIKLADFGLAMEVKDLIYTVCGTPTYVAPEILSEIGYGLEVDMWACGVITYILLCGFPPFRSLDRNQDELFKYIQAGEFEYLMPYWEGISESSKDLINHLLVVDKSKRWKAVDVLCHPWILSQGNSKPLPANFEKFTQDYQIELAEKARSYALEPLISK